jgi:riboflavin synthase
MFTGIIEGLGTIRSIRASGEGRRFAIEADFSLDRTKIGDSIAVNGACLTAVSLSGNRFEADLSPETLDVSAMGALKVGDRVNVERALRLSDRIDGHLVSGHIDGVGRIITRERQSNAIIVTFGVEAFLARYMIKKGSVAVDGVSLTINSLGESEFSVSIIPHTAGLTTIGIKQTGDPVNIETDLIGKYIERFMILDNSRPHGADTRKESKVDMALLARTGFL